VRREEGREGDKGIAYHRRKLEEVRNKGSRKVRKEGVEANMDEDVERK
jgi:hypothetical protein